MRLLVAVDGTPDSDRALDHGQELARAAGADLVLVHAVEPKVRETVGEPVSGPEDVGDRLMMEGTDDAEERGAEILAAAANRVDDDIGVETELLYGSPAEAITEFAETAGADGILVGHRNLSEEQERLIGSVAKRLVERSSVPVTVVR